MAAKYNGWKKFDQKTSLNIIRHFIPEGNDILSRSIKSLLYLFWTLRLYFKYNFTKIHCGQVLSSGLTGFIMNQLFNIPYIVYIYGSETFRFGTNQLLSYLMYKVLLSAETIVPNSEFTKEEFIEFGIPENKFKKVTPGVDTKKFNPSSPDPNLLDKYNLQDKKILLTVGRLDIRKGHDRVIEAISELKDRYPKLRYLIVGEGREKQRLKNLADKYNIQENVIFCGYVPDEDLPEYYKVCDIFILMNRQTSQDPRLKGDYEGFGIVFLEAAASGKPVIAGDFGGIRDAVVNGETGYIIEDRINKIQKYIKLFFDNAKQAQKMGQKGRKRTEEKFTWKLKSQQIKPIL